METTIAFVLGITSGLLAIMLIGSFIGVLKMRKEVAGLKSDINSIYQTIGHVESGFIHRIDEDIRNRDTQISEFRRDVDNRFEETYRVMGSNHSDVHHRIDEVGRYVDKRIDKTVDTLSQRMDILLNDGLKAYHGTKEEELIKS